MTTKQLADKIGLNYEHDTKIVTLEETLDVLYGGYQLWGILAMTDERLAELKAIKADIQRKDEGEDLQQPCYKR